MPVDVPYNPDFAPEVPESSSIRKMEPQNIEAEKSVLAACLLNQEAIEDVAAKLIPDNFYRAAHQRIFEPCSTSTRVISRLTRFRLR